MDDQALEGGILVLELEDLVSNRTRLLLFPEKNQKQLEKIEKEIQRVRADLLRRLQIRPHT